MPAVLSHAGSLLPTARNLTIQRFLYKDRPAMTCFLGMRIKYEIVGAILLVDNQAVKHGTYSVTSVLNFIVMLPLS